MAEKALDGGSNTRVPAVLEVEYEPTSNNTGKLVREQIHQ